MSSKKLLRFYFRAQRINEALDNLIMRTACASADEGKTCESYAEKIISLIESKRKLCELWAYLDGVMETFDGGDKGVLLSYALSRGGYSSLPRDRANFIRRVVVRFMRRAKYLCRHEEAADIVSRYYAMLGR